MQERRARIASGNPHTNRSDTWGQRTDHDRKAPSELGEAKSIIRRVVAAGNRHSLVADVACEIGAEIVEGILRPGDTLSSLELARRFATSRTPIREALMLLEKEGLVVVSPRRRARVVTFALADIRTIYSIRTTLLELVATDVASHATEDDLADLRAILARMKRACQKSDVHAYFWANVEFNDRNTLAARNPIAKRIVDSLQLRTLPLRRLSLSVASRLRESFEDHVQILRAYERRDGNLAAALIRSNHMRALTALEITLAAETSLGVQRDGHSGMAPEAD